MPPGRFKGPQGPIGGIVQRGAERAASWGRRAAGRGPRQGGQKLALHQDIHLKTVWFFCGLRAL